MYLTREELATYRQDGVLRQRQLIEPELVSTFRDAIQQEVLDRPSTTLSHHSLPPKERLEIDRHLDSRLVYDLCTRPEVLQPLTQILGEDIMLFRSRFFDKQAWSAEIPWHQESYFWKVDKRWVTVWFAIDDVTTGNGLLQLVPGSHHSAREHMYIPKQHSYWSTFKEMACMKSSDPILDCPTPAGEFIFFDDLLHRSLANNTDHPRLAFAARYAPPDITGVHENAYQGHRCLLVHGNATTSNLRFANPPQRGSRLNDVLDRAQEMQVGVV